jgi:hypothetical protein
LIGQYAAGAGTDDVVDRSVRSSRELKILLKLSGMDTESRSWRRRRASAWLRSRQRGACTSQVRVLPIDHFVS